MIQIKFDISSSDFKTTKKIQFCNKNEKNLDILYGIAKESVERKEKNDFEQLMVICCFHITKEIRKNTVVEIIEKKILVELSRYQSTLQILRRVKEIYIEAIIDNIPKKVLNFSSKNRSFMPILAKQQVLR